MNPPSPHLSQVLLNQKGRRPSQSIIHRLNDRQLGLRFRNVPFHSTRIFYQNIVPNFTCTNIERPPCFLRKFTPDGSFLIAFSSDQTSIEVYEYQGCAAAETLLKDWPSNFECTEDDVQDPLLVEIRHNIFSKLFKLKHTINVTSNNEQLHRECGLFTDDSRYFIAASAAISEESHYFDVYRTNESISLASRITLEDYGLYLVDLKEGRLCDKKIFKTDKIYLSHNQGIFLYENTLAVLSLQHQQIHIYKIYTDSNGSAKLEVSRVIGRVCFEDDALLLRAIRDDPSSVPTNRAFRERTINSLKHRIITYLFKDAYYSGSSLQLRRFYQHFDQFCSLRMFKLQLLSPDHLLIRLTAESNIPRLGDLCPCVFVFYEIEKARVIAIYDNSSADLLWLYENFCDQFRCTRSCTASQITCSPSNNYYSRISQRRFKQTLINARNGGYGQAVKQLLAQLPITAQSYTCTPYLDLSLFSYDDKWMSTTERPKNLDENAIRFYTRESGYLRFKIYAGLKRLPNGKRPVAAFTFHPTDPLAISVQRTESEYVVNLHLRHT